MDVIGLLILLLPALSTTSLAASREYHLVSQPKTWSEAQSYCRENFHDLSTMESDDDWFTVREMVANSGQSCVWFGLYDDVNSWRWPRDNTSLFGEGTTFGSWFYYVFDNTGSCGCMYQKHVDDYFCETPQRFVCYDEDSNTFIPVTTPMTWHTAESYCGQTYTELADVRTQESYNAVTSVIDGGVWWIGLIRDSWKWSDQSDSSYRKWDNGLPNKLNGHCACTYVSGWHDDICAHNRAFICSVSTKKVLKVMLKFGGSVDPNDPQVQEAALKQVEKQLREQGVHQGFRLRWRKQPDGKVFNKTEL